MSHQVSCQHARTHRLLWPAPAQRRCPAPCPPRASAAALPCTPALPTPTPQPHLTVTTLHAGATVKPTSKIGAPLASDERDALVAGLQRAAAGSWKIVFVCARARPTDCGCPYAIEFKHNGNHTVTVTQTEAHHFHDPSSAEDKAKLKIHPLLHTIGTMALRLGVKPMQVCNELNATALRKGLLGSGGSALEQAGNARASITLAQVKALAKQLRRASGYGLTGDANAITAQLEEYARRGCVPFFQPYRASSGPAGEQPLIIILQTPFQQRMLGQFGSHLVFMDATFGTNKYGYPLYALTVSAGQQVLGSRCWRQAGGGQPRNTWQTCSWQTCMQLLQRPNASCLACRAAQVQDDVGRGVPVGYMICSSDTVEVVEHFLRVLQQGVSGPAECCTAPPCCCTAGC